jgi:HD-GYP domain-containing protein (c-di-GMP phosphodiesterase class II)
VLYSCKEEKTAMDYPESGIIHRKNGQAIEKVVTSKGLELSLLASGDGTEIIHHRLAAGYQWAIGPEEGWNALEFFLVLSGKLLWKLPDGEVTIHAGHSISATPVRKYSIFVAEVDSEFLYVSSSPVFHHYSQAVQEMMELAVSVEQKDGYTADHCQRIMKLSMLVGETMGLSSNQLYELNFGAFFHDVGKVKVPEAILGKPSALTVEEWAIMKLHTVYGRQMLEEMKLPYLRNAATIIEQHHERYDGSGYPHGLQGEEISIGAAIIAVVDSYDAMTTNRVYRKGRSKEEALIEIEKGSGSLYRSDVVNAFFSVSNKIDYFKGDDV